MNKVQDKVDSGETATSGDVVIITPKELDDASNFDERTVQDSTQSNAYTYNGVSFYDYMVYYFNWYTGYVTIARGPSSAQVAANVVDLSENSLNTQIHVM